MDTYLLARAMITQLLKASVWVLHASAEECTPPSLQNPSTSSRSSGTYIPNMSSLGINSKPYRKHCLSFTILLKLAKGNILELCFYWGSVMLRMHVTSEDTSKEDMVCALKLDKIKWRQTRCFFFFLNKKLTQAAI